MRMVFYLFKFTNFQHVSIILILITRFWAEGVVDTNDATQPPVATGCASLDEQGVGGERPVKCDVAIVLN